jgi:hypothetical protein
MAGEGRTNDAFMCMTDKCRGGQMSFLSLRSDKCRSIALGRTNDRTNDRTKDRSDKRRL